MSSKRIIKTPKIPVADIERKANLNSKLALLTESSVWVRSVDGEETFSLSVISDKDSTALVTLNPKQSGEVRQTLARLAKKIGLDDDAKIQLLSGATGDEAEVDGMNSYAWKESKVLRIESEVKLLIPIQYNPACVTEIFIGRRIVVGCKLVPRISLEFSRAEDARVCWKRCPPSDSTAAVIVGHGAEYIPRQEDVGHAILCEVLPVGAAGQAGLGGTTGAQGVFKRRANGEAEGSGRKKASSAADPDAAAAAAAAAADGAAGPVVEDFPADWPVAPRLAAGRTGALRVCSYNTLCDQFCDTAWARENLYAGCPPAYLSVHYRARLLLRELEGYGADLVCLQEVEAATLSGYLEPVLGRAGYACWYSPKPGKSGWGLCLAWRAARLRPLERRRVELFDPREWARVPGAEGLCGRWPALREAMAECGTVAQLARFQVLEEGAAPDAPRRTLCAANTHLFGNPDGPHVRLLQAAIVLR